MVHTEYKFAGNVEFMELAVRLPLHHGHAPTVCVVIRPVRDGTAAQFIVLPVAQCDLLSLFGHDEFRAPVVFPIAIAHEFPGGYMVDIIYTASVLVGSQSRVNKGQGRVGPVFRRPQGQRG